MQKIVSESNIRKFSNLICKIEYVNKDEKKEGIKDEEKGNLVIERINKYFIKHPIEKIPSASGRVWILIGKDKNTRKLVSLMVAQSEDIQSEIISDVKAMYNLPYTNKERGSINLDEEPKDVSAKINSNGNIYWFPEGKEKYKKYFLYRYLYKSYIDMKIFEVKIDEYLNINQNNLNDAIKDFFMLSKDYYAESKLAFETQAKYWNYYKSGVGKRYWFLLKDRQDKAK